MCATARHDVRSGPLPGRAAAGDWLAAGPPDLFGALATVLVTGSCSDPSESTEPTREPAPARTAPDRPATATTTTATVPVVAATPGRLASRSVRRRPPARSLAQARPIAPCLIGSSISCQDRAASRIDAAICSACQRQAWLGAGRRRHHDDGKVPEVDAVGADSDPAQRPPAERRADDARRIGGRGDDCHGRDRQQDQAAAIGERRVLPDPPDHQADPGQAREPRDVERDPRQLARRGAVRPPLVA